MIQRAHHSSTAVCMVMPSERGAACRRDGHVLVNRYPSPTRRWILADPIPDQVQVHQPGDHVEFMVELAYGSVVLICQARVTLEPSDEVLHAHPGEVDFMVLLLLGSQGAMVFGFFVGGSWTWRPTDPCRFSDSLGRPRCGSCILPRRSRHAWTRPICQTVMIHG